MANQFNSHEKKPFKTIFVSLSIGGLGTAIYAHQRCIYETFRGINKLETIIKKLFQHLHVLIRAEAAFMRFISTFFRVKLLIIT